MQPKDVVSPKDRFRLIEVLHTGKDPGDKDYSWSLCLGMWKEPKGPSLVRVGIRWDGKSNKEKGNPTSHGQPTWFLLPHEVVDPALVGLQLP